MSPNAAVMVVNGTVTFNTTGGSATPEPQPQPALEPQPEPQPDPSPAPSDGTGTIKLRVAGDRYNGDPQFTVFVDGKQIGGVYSAKAVHAQNRWEDVVVTGDFDPAKPHTVEVRFINNDDDGKGGDGHDRNLYIDWIEIGGKRYEGEHAANDASRGYDAMSPNAAVMVVNGTVTFNTTGGSTTPEPQPAPVEPFTLPLSKPATTTLNGGNGNDTITGTSGNDRLDGKAGADTMSGGAGDDTYVVDSAGGDVIIEAPDAGIDTAIVWAREYTLPDNVENMELRGAYGHKVSGNALDNLMIGGSYDDTMDGGAGRDILVGGIGADTLIGGPGSDMFVYNSIAEKGDVIKDFTVGEDLLDLRGLMSEIDEFGENPFESGRIKFIAEGNGTAVMIDDDLDPSTAMEKLVVLENVLPTALKATDVVWA